MLHRIAHLLALAYLAQCRLLADDANMAEMPKAHPRSLQKALPPVPDTLSSPGELIDQYYNIFRTGNRNAASHLWMSFVLNRSTTMTDATIKDVFKGFCAISGSPVSNGDSPGRIYKVTLLDVLGENITGVVRHCCWPCVCDLTEQVRVDTLTVQTADGPKEHHMLVMGDPCKAPEQLTASFTDPFGGGSRSLAQAAPELGCVGAPGAMTLKGAIYSDHGFPIIGYLFTDQSELDKWIPYDQMYTDWNPSNKITGDDRAWGWGQSCAQRAASGYNSGMGLIFRQTALITPMPAKVDDTSRVTSASAASSDNGNTAFGSSDGATGNNTGVPAHANGCNPLLSGMLSVPSLCMILSVLQILP
jgi:hypothetical protein